MAVAAMLAGACSSVVPAFAQDNPADGTPLRTVTTRYGGWLTQCSYMTDDSKDRGSCAAELRIIKRNTSQVIFSWAIQPNADGAFTGAIVVPTGVKIANGLVASFDGGTPRTLSFSTCEPTNCASEFPMDDKFITEMTKANTGKITVTGSRGDEVNFNVNLAGFSKMMSALRH